MFMSKMYMFFSKICIIFKSFIITRKFLLNHQSPSPEKFRGSITEVQEWYTYKKIPNFSFLKYIRVLYHIFFETLNNSNKLSISNRLISKSRKKWIFQIFYFFGFKNFTFVSKWQ